MFEEVRIDPVGDTAIGLMRRLHGPVWAGKRKRASKAADPDGDAPQVTTIPFSQAIATRP